MSLNYRISGDPALSTYFLTYSEKEIKTKLKLDQVNVI